MHPISRTLTMAAVAALTVAATPIAQAGSPDSFAMSVQDPTGDATITADEGSAPPAYLAERADLEAFKVRVRYQKVDRAAVYVLTWRVGKVQPSPSGVEDEEQRLVADLSLVDTDGEAAGRGKVEMLLDGYGYYLHVRGPGGSKAPRCTIAWDDPQPSDPARIDELGSRLVRVSFLDSCLTRHPDRIESVALSPRTTVTVGSAGAVDDTDDQVVAPLRSAYPQG